MELDDAFPTQPQRFHRPSAQSYKFYKPPSTESYRPSSPSWTPTYKPPTYEPSTYELERFRISPPNTETTYPVIDSQTPSYKPSVPSYDPSSHEPPTYKPSAPSWTPTYKPPSAQSYKPSAPSWTPTYKPPTYEPPTYELERFRISPPNTETTYPVQTPSYKPSVPSYDPSSHEPPTYKLSAAPYKPPTYEPYVLSVPHFQPPPPSGLVPQDPHPLFGEIGLHCYNLLNGTNLEFLDLDKFYLTGLVYKKIKLNAYDAIRNAYREFITRVVPSEIDKVYMRFITTQCTLLPDVGDDYPCDFDELAVNDFFKGDMPNSMPAEDTSDNPQYYELKESEVEENMEWLHVYADLAFYTKLHYIPNSRVWRRPYNLAKVIVQTREDVESEKKAMALNAIFYIHIKTFRGQDCYATIRRTTDGIPGLMSLEVKCLM